MNKEKTGWLSAGQRAAGGRPRGEGAGCLCTQRASWPRKVGGGRGQGIFLWHLGPTLKAPGSLTKSRTRVTQPCPCEARM